MARTQTRHPSERVRLMKENFMELHNDGKTIQEIADHFHLTTATIYNYLQEIADANGVSRESLLQIVHKQHVMLKTRTPSPRDKIEINEIKQSFSALIKDTDNLIGKFDKFLEENSLWQELSQQKQ